MVLIFNKANFKLNIETKCLCSRLGRSHNPNIHFNLVQLPQERQKCTKSHKSDGKPRLITNTLN